MTDVARKTSSRTIFIFVIGSIVALLALAWLFRPPVQQKVRAPQPAAAAPGE